MKLNSAVFYTNNLNKVIEFYRDFLGLPVDYIQENKFASFKFENRVKLGIKQKNEDREIPGAQTIFIETNDIKNLYAEFKEKGAVIEKELIKQDWGINFSILDPDKNKIQFVQFDKLN